MSFTAASLKIDQACHWISSWGLNYTNTRFHRYQRLFQELARAESHQDFWDILDKYEFHIITNAINEANEFLRIYEGLKHETHPQLKFRLKRILQGHELFAKDISGARDFSLELDVIARFAKDGFPIDHSHIADLATDVNGIPVFAECKRLRSHNKVAANIKEGLDQLTKRYDSHRTPASARGLLVLSIAALLNPSLEPSKGVDSARLQRDLERLHRDFVEQHKHHWEGRLCDPRTIAVVLIYNVPAIVNRRLTTCHQLDIRHRHNLAHADVLLAKQIEVPTKFRLPWVT